MSVKYEHDSGSSIADGSSWPESDLYAENAWYYSYKPSQVTEDGHTVITNTLEATSITGTKTWVDDNNKWGHPPWYRDAVERDVPTPALQ